MPRRRPPAGPPLAAPDLRVPPAEPGIAQVRGLLAETQALSARLAALHEIATLMQSSLDTASVLGALAREARWVLDFQHCSVAEIDGAGYWVQPLAAHGAAEPPREFHELAEGGPVAAAIRAGHALLLQSLQFQPNVPAGMASALIVPLLSRGTIIGTLNFFATAPCHYRIDDLRIAGALAAQAAVVIQNTRLFEAVSSARDELHTVLESISDGVIVVGADQGVLLINQAGRQMLGLADRPLVGVRLATLALRARAQGRRLISRRQIDAIDEQASLADHGTLQLGDGRHLEWRRTPIRGPHATAGHVITLRDVTTRVQLDELRDDLMAMLVHDLRTPLTAMLLSLDMQEYPSLGPAEQAELRERTRQSARQMLRHVNTLLDLRKLEAGRLELTPEPTLAADLIETVLAAFGVPAGFGGLTLHAAVPADMPPATLDRSLVARVLENLVGNAVKFTDPGGRITLRADYDERWLLLSVEDTGIGVPDALREQIFDKYAQATKEHQRRGTGLGLAFCRLVAEAHQGQIGVRENPGGGSIFWLRLPLAAPPGPGSAGPAGG